MAISKAGKPPTPMQRLNAATIARRAQVLSPKGQADMADDAHALFTVLGYSNDEDWKEFSRNRVDRPNGHFGHAVRKLALKTAHEIHQAVHNVGRKCPTADDVIRALDVEDSEERKAITDWVNRILAREREEAEAQALATAG